MRTRFDLSIRNGFNNFITEITNEYRVTREDVMKAIDFFGEFRSKVRAYFTVRAYQLKKGLTVENMHDSVVNTWFRMS